MHPNMNVRELMLRLDYRFKNPALLEEALTHPSVLAGKDPRAFRSYQRLEFVGDTVVNLFIAEELFRRFPDAPEGDLTKFKGYLGSNEKLSEIAQTLNLGQLVMLSRGEESQGGRTNKYILACVLEAVAGAMFVDGDGGYLAVRKILNKYLFTDQWFKTLTQTNLANFDPKSTLQQIAQSKFDITPSYRVVDVSGPQHEQQFSVGAMLEETQIGVGRGSSKQEAQKNAALNALEETQHLSQNLPFGALRARAILDEIIPTESEGGEEDGNEATGSRTRIVSANVFRRGRKRGFKFNRRWLK